ncbi:hypothetical protein HOLleu_01371 [Holothuria leucospilota]|uniref:Uncharacterized protein n=1 Tax=Holothuria leucospilota TaxID=206669 RepID=A0A9Q1CPV2_HOLLE|nr:hypothetical protein HOLleu_01371 [Holothuria leucospilota]
MQQHSDIEDIGHNTRLKVVGIVHKLPIPWDYNELVFRFKGRYPVKLVARFFVLRVAVYYDS